MQVWKNKPYEKEQPVRMQKIEKKTAKKWKGINANQK
jgi:hypothetical protein